MFTGIIAGTGRVVGVSRDTGNRSAARLTVSLGRHSRGLKAGQSVALNGVCLTAIRVNKASCVFEMIDETIQRTNLGALKPGETVNLERSLKLGDRLEGHFVLGHVDGVGRIIKIKKKSKEVRLRIQIPKKLSKFVVKKGSIAVDGISLTVTDIKNDIVSVSLIPHTVSVTNFQTRKPSDKVNIETDILGRYVLG